MTEKPKGLSSDCTLNASLVMAIMMGGREHPCDRCNEDRNVCRGYPRKAPNAGAGGVRDA